MVAGNWLDPDGLYRQYGTSKAVPETGGEYLSLGENRTVEILIDLTTLTTTPVVQANTLFFPIGTNIQIDQVETIAEIAGLGGTSFSVGLLATDRVTPLSNTAFVAAQPLADHDLIGEKRLLTAGSTAAGNYIGATPGAYIGGSTATPTAAGYISALAAGTYSAGKVRVRIKYHGVGTITQ